MNTGLIDRFVRVALGIALIAFGAGYIYPGTGWNWIGWFGMILLISGTIGWCPLYALLGVSTCTRHA